MCDRHRKWLQTSASSGTPISKKCVSTKGMHTLYSMVLVVTGKENSSPLGIVSTCKYYICLNAQTVTINNNNSMSF